MAAGVVPTAVFLCVLSFAILPPARPYPLLRPPACRYLALTDARRYGPLQAAPIPLQAALADRRTVSSGGAVTEVLTPEVELGAFYDRLAKVENEGGGALHVEDCPAAQGWVHPYPSVERVVLVTAPYQEPREPALGKKGVVLFLLSSDALSRAVLTGANLTVQYQCSPTAAEECWNIAFKDHTLGPIRSRFTRDQGSRLSPRSLPEDVQHQDGGGGSLSLLVMVGVLGVGIVGLIAVLALCGNSSAKIYEPAGAVTNFRVMSSDEVARSSIQGVTMATHDQQAEGSRDVSVTNGVAAHRSADGGQSAEQKSDSLRSDRRNSPGREASPRDSGGGRWSSSRSHEPLPAPPLVMQGEGPSVEGQPPVENEEEHEYAYARVPQADQMEGSESEGEGGEEDNGESPAAPLPVGDPTVLPYGKVTRPPSQTAPERPQSAGDESYTEVRVTSRYHPKGKGARGRSATEPLDPVDAQWMRDHRAFTESATHLPLPAIPNLQVNDEKMYDSIPEGSSQLKASGKKSSPGARAKRERLYEAMDDMDEDGPEDTYETVPDDIKPEDPRLSSASSSPPVPLPHPSPTKRPSPSATVPAPPASPIPRKFDRDDRKKKELSKTVSDSEARKSRAFSLFNRKKTPSLSAGTGKTRTDFEQPSPLLQGPGVRHPPSIPPPAPPIDDDEEDDTYETPDRPPLTDSKRLSSESDVSPSLRQREIELAKAKSASLPMTLRSGPGFFDPKAPLPEVPEDSGSGAVTVGFPPRPLSDPVAPEDEEPNYDSLQPQAEDNEEDPYDTVRQEDLLQILGEREEPGYDKVRGKARSEEAQPVGSPPPEDGEEDGAEATVAGYAKVTTPVDPKEEDSETTPEHDEFGYACVPQEFRMRKRTLSATAAGTQKEKDPGYSSVKEIAEMAQRLEEEPGYDSIRPAETAKRSGITPEDVERQRSPPVEILSSPMDPGDENYASVDREAKWLSRSKKTPGEGGGLDPGYDELRGITPPPPIPVPAVDLGVDLAEFEQPPVPLQSPRMLQLVSDTDDPDDPYAKILPAPESGADPPYAQVDIKEEPPYASINKTKTTEQVRDKASGYDTADIVTPPAKAQATVADAALGYDTVGEDHSDLKSPKESELEREMPKLETAEVVQPTYDRLEPEEPQQRQPMYDSLGPEEDDQLRPPSREQKLSQDSYEEIDENARLKYLERFRQKH